MAGIASVQAQYAPGATGPAGPAGPPGPAGNPYESVTTDDAASAGQVARRVASGNVEVGDGITAADGDGVIGLYGAAVAGGGTAQVYRSGSRCPVAGLPVGALWRSNTGTAVLYASLTPGDYTNRLGYSDGNGVDVNVGPSEQV